MSDTEQDLKRGTQDGRQAVFAVPQIQREPMPFWVQILLIIVLGASFTLNIAQAYHRHMFEQNWEDCPSGTVYRGTCIPGADPLQGGVDA